MDASFSHIKHLTILTTCAQFYTGCSNTEAPLAGKFDKKTLHVIKQDLYYQCFARRFTAMLFFATLDPILRSY